MDELLQWWQEDAERLNQMAQSAASSGNMFDRDQPPPVPPALNVDGGLVEEGSPAEEATETKEEEAREKREGLD